MCLCSFFSRHLQHAHIYYHRLHDVAFVTQLASMYVCVFIPFYFMFECVCVVVLSLSLDCYHLLPKLCICTKFILPLHCVCIFLQIQYIHIYQTTKSRALTRSLWKYLSISIEWLIYLYWWWWTQNMIALHKTLTKSNFIIITIFKTMYIKCYTPLSTLQLRKSLQKYIH